MALTDDIVEVLAERDQPTRADALANATGAELSSVRATLSKLAGAGEVMTWARGLYVHKDYAGVPECAEASDTAGEAPAVGESDPRAEAGERRRLHERVAVAERLLRIAAAELALVRREI